MIPFLILTKDELRVQDNNLISWRVGKIEISTMEEEGGSVSRIKKSRHTLKPYL